MQTRSEPATPRSFGINDDQRRIASVGLNDLPPNSAKPVSKKGIMRKMKATAQKGAATRVSDDGNERNVQGFLANPNISLRRKISRNGNNNISSDVCISLLTYFHKG